MPGPDAGAASREARGPREVALSRAPTLWYKYALFSLRSPSCLVYAK